MKRGSFPKCSVSITYILFLVMGSSCDPLWGPIWVSFCFISSPWKSFFNFNFEVVIVLFWPLKLFIPRGGINLVIPYGVPFASLCVLYLSLKKFFDFNFGLAIVFFWPLFFYPIWRDQLSDTLWGPIRISLCFISSPVKIFFDFKLPAVFCGFWFFFQKNSWF